VRIRSGPATVTPDRPPVRPSQETCLEARCTRPFAGGVRRHARGLPTVRPPSRTWKRRAFSFSATGGLHAIRSHGPSPRGDRVSAAVRHGVRARARAREGLSRGTGTPRPHGSPGGRRCRRHARAHRPRPKDRLARSKRHGHHRLSGRRRQTGRPHPIRPRSGSRRASQPRGGPRSQHRGDRRAPARSRDRLVRTRRPRARATPAGGRHPGLRGRDPGHGRGVRHDRSGRRPRRRSGPRRLRSRRATRHVRGGGGRRAPGAAPDRAVSHRRRPAANGRSQDLHRTGARDRRGETRVPGARRGLADGRARGGHGSESGRDRPAGGGKPACTEALAGRPGWRDLAAVREGRVVEIDADLLARPGPDLGRAARVLRDGLSAVDGGSR